MDRRQNAWNWRLGLTRRTLAVLTALYLLLVAGYYWPDPMGALAVLRIPMVEYGIAFIIALLVWLGLLAYRRLAAPVRSPPQH